MRRGAGAALLALVVAAAAGALHAARRLAAPDSAPGRATANPAPDFRLKTLDGSRTVALADLRGRVVLLNFWATWCAPCKIEMPWLVELDAAYRSAGLEVVGVAMDDAGPGEVAKFARDQRAAYTMLAGDEVVARAYGGARLLPQTFLIGRDGALLQSFAGLHDRAELEAAVRGTLDATAH